jgi:hypothetical protein
MPAAGRDLSGGTIMATGKAYFVIADISGYTRFMAQTEIDHAKGVLEELFGAVVSAIRAPLAVSGLQGDAVFAYALDSDLVSRQFVLDFSERVYFAFAETRERMRINTTCPCAACARIGDLDLKIVVHHGEFVEQTTGGRTELAGKDVITAFRLLKNHVVEKTGIRAYALFTRDAARHMELETFFATGNWQKETYEHIGEVEFVVHDLAPTWKKKRDAERKFLTATDDLLIPELAVALPISPGAAFAMITRPDLRGRWVAAQKIDVENADSGRIEPGAIYHCHHGKQEIVYEIIDWRPGEYLTTEYRLPLGLKFRETDELAPVGEGTMLKARFSRLFGGSFAGRLMKPLIESQIRKQMMKDGGAIVVRLKESADALLKANNNAAPAAAADAGALGVDKLAASKLAA